jgi:hypothetical protein
MTSQVVATKSIRLFRRSSHPADEYVCGSLTKCQKTTTIWH